MFSRWAGSIWAWVELGQAGLDQVGRGLSQAEPSVGKHHLREPLLMQSLSNLLAQRG